MINSSESTLCCSPYLGKNRRFGVFFLLFVFLKSKATFLSREHIRMRSFHRAGRKPGYFGVKVPFSPSLPSLQRRVRWVLRQRVQLAGKKELTPLGSTPEGAQCRWGDVTRAGQQSHTINNWCYPLWRTPMARHESMHFTSLAHQSRLIQLVSSFCRKGNRHRASLASWPYF